VNMSDKLRQQRIAAIHAEWHRDWYPITPYADRSTVKDSDYNLEFVTADPPLEAEDDFHERLKAAGLL